MDIVDAQREDTGTCEQLGIHNNKWDGGVCPQLAGGQLGVSIDNDDLGGASVWVEWDDNKTAYESFVMWPMRVNEVYESGQRCTDFVADVDVHE
jgi:hypothetical protein